MNLRSLFDGVSFVRAPGQPIRQATKRAGHNDHVIVLHAPSDNYRPHRFPRKKNNGPTNITPAEPLAHLHATFQAHRSRSQTVIRVTRPMIAPPLAELSEALR